ncbi:ribonuclease H-like domain-containing protein [Tanacetum coccineum]
MNFTHDDLIILRGLLAKLGVNDNVTREQLKGNWKMDTSSHLNDSVHSLSDVLNMCIYPLFQLVMVIPYPLPTLAIFVRDNNYTVVFDAFGFSVKDFMTRQVLLRCDSTSDLYPVTKPSTIPHAFLTSEYMWHQRLGHPGSEVLRRILSNNSISYKEKPPVLCHTCQLGKHVRLSFVRSNRPPERLNLHASSISPLPKSYTDAFNEPNWQNAMRDEYNALIKNDTWTLVPDPRTPILFVLEGIDVDETFSPVVKPGTIQTTLFEEFCISLSVLCPPAPTVGEC